MIFTSNCLSCLHNLSTQKLKFWRISQPITCLLQHASELSHSENKQGQWLEKRMLAQLPHFLAVVQSFSALNLPGWQMGCTTIPKLPLCSQDLTSREFFLWELIKNRVGQSPFSYVQGMKDPTATLHQKSGREQTVARNWLSLGCRPHHSRQQSLLIVQN
jgi:hypothetical protein